MINHHHHSYEIGDIALSCDIDTSHAADTEAKRAATTLRVGDGAFVRRSDHVWRYAVVSRVSRGADPSILFTVDGRDRGSKKSVPRRHWGDSVRPLQREMAARRERNASRLVIEKGLRSSHDTQMMHSFNSQDKAELQVSADASSYDGSGGTESGPVEELDEVVVSKHRPGVTRRESLKDMAVGFIGRFAGSKEQAQVNRLASEDHDEDTKIHYNSPVFDRTKGSWRPATDKSSRCGEAENAPAEELDEAVVSKQQPRVTRRESLKDMAAGFITIMSSGHSELDGSPEDIKVGPRGGGETTVATEGSNATNQNRRRPNKQKRASFTLTTSGIFKNLMKEDVLGGSEATRRIRHANAIGPRGDEATPPSAAGKYKPKRGRRRATVASGRPSRAALGQPESRGATTSKSNSSSPGVTPRASLLMKDVFARVMEEKMCSGQKQMGSSD